jgi:hypothetical protein
MVASIALDALQHASKHRRVLARSAQNPAHCCIAVTISDLGPVERAYAHQEVSALVFSVPIAAADRVWR